MDEYRVTFNGETQTFRFNEPVKFEVGQVVRVKLPERRHATVVLITCVDIGRELVHGLDHASGSRAIVLFMDASLYATELLSPAPRVGDKWTNGESVARVSADPDTAQLCLVTEGDPFVGDVVAVARRLWEGGYRVARARSASESSADVLASMARAGVKKWSDRGTLGVSNAADVRERFAAFMPRDPDLSGASGAPAYLTLDYLKALVPTHAEATARRMLTFDEMLASDPYARALIEDAHAGDLYSRVLVQADAEIKKAILGTSEREWQQQTAYPREVDGVFRDALPRAGEVYQNATHTVRTRVCADGDLRTPDARPFAALANAVADIFATPDLATSRRYIDMAIASVRGEPFAHAVAAVLVAASEVPLSAHTIAGIVRGARSHERRRSEVAPGRRELTDAQLSKCSAAAFYDADGCWDERLSRIYERARAAG